MLSGGLSCCTWEPQNSHRGRNPITSRSLHEVAVTTSSSCGRKRRTASGLGSRGWKRTVTGFKVWPGPPPTCPPGPSSAAPRMVVCSSGPDVSGNTWSPKLLHKFNDVMWHASCSITANILAVSGVTLWKESVDGQRVCISDVNKSRGSVSASVTEGQQRSDKTGGAWLPPTSSRTSPSWANRPNNWEEPPAATGSFSQ
ncbi:Protein SEC13-like protein [Plecturocebus cupreus]